MKIKKGIENLLPARLFEDRFYSEKLIEGNYGEKKSIQEFKKMEFCKWVCKEQKNSENFEKFSVVVDIIKKWIGMEVFLISLLAA